MKGQHVDPQDATKLSSELSRMPNVNWIIGQAWH
jgi:hypothetical protein